MTRSTKTPPEDARLKVGALRGLILLDLLHDGYVDVTRFVAALDEFEDLTVRGSKRRLIPDPDKTGDIEFTRALKLLRHCGYDLVGERSKWHLGGPNDAGIGERRFLPLANGDRLRLELLADFYEKVRGSHPLATSVAALAKDASGCRVSFEFDGELILGVLIRTKLEEDADRIAILTEETVESFPLRSITGLAIYDFEGYDEGRAEQVSVVHEATHPQPRGRSARSGGRPTGASDFVELRRLNFVATRFFPFGKPFTLADLAETALLTSDRVESLVPSLVVLNRLNLEFQGTEGILDWLVPPEDTRGYEGMAALYFFTVLEALGGLAGVVLEEHHRGGSHDVERLANTLHQFLSKADLPMIDTEIPFLTAHELVCAQIELGDLQTHFRVKKEGSDREHFLQFGGLEVRRGTWWTRGIFDGKQLESRSLRADAILSAEVIE